MGGGGGVQGSSPHTRGAPERCRAGRDPGRIIPAYAGSTIRTAAGWLGSADHPRIRGEHRSATSTTGSASPDHPRIRGEHYLSEFESDFQGGSSPHTRGARREELQETLVWRIIPAYAGSTPAAARRWRLPADHPRIRGEHLNERAARQRRKGSSPHTRGALRQQHLPCPGCRIIPAYAGSTAAAHHILPLDSRIIPAYAGSTCRGVGFACCRGDHPRIRGEHRKMRAMAGNLKGSSPHTRGAPKL